MGSVVLVMTLSLPHNWGMLHFRTTVVPFGPAAAIMLSDEQAASIASARTPPVVVTVDGRSQRLRISRMGGPACIALSKAARKALQVDIGDEIEVGVELDRAERTVEVPADLAAELATDERARAAWEKLSYTRRKEIAGGLVEAKRPETRARRLASALEELRA